MWRIYQNIASSRKGYAGVATISKINLTQLPIDIPNQRFREGGRMLLFQYQDCHIINIYFPQGDRTKKDVPYKLEVCDYIYLCCDGPEILSGCSFFENFLNRLCSM
mgnify:CR=1 FL=1